MTLRYRMYRACDESALVRLWSEHGGWDDIDEVTWRLRFVEAPTGPAHIVVAEANDAIVGQLAFLPSPVLVDGELIPSLRAFAAILDKKARGLLRATDFSTHPVVAMYRKAIPELRDGGYRLIHMLPDPAWIPLLRLFPELMIARFRLWSLPLPLGDPFRLPPQYTAHADPCWDDRVDALWSKASQLHRCIVRRDSTTLPSRTIGPHRVTFVDRNGNLAGLAISEQRGDRQWLLCDLLSSDLEESLRATLAAACNFGDSVGQNGVIEKPLRKIAILGAAAIQPVIAELGFREDGYSFHQVVHVLDPGLDPELVAPHRWYLTAND